MVPDFIKCVSSGDLAQGSYYRRLYCCLLKHKDWVESNLPSKSLAEPRNKGRCSRNVLSSSGEWNNVPPPQDVHVLISRTCECVILYGKGALGLLAACRSWKRRGNGFSLPRVSRRNASPPAFLLESRETHFGLQSLRTVV